MTSDQTLRWRYATRSGFEVTGDGNSLRCLAGVIRSGDANAFSGVRLETQSDPSPYEEFMRRVVVQHDGGRVRVVKDRDIVLIMGSAEYLAILADNIEAVVENPDVNDHLHIEYYAEHLYLDETSEPLVVELQR